MFIKLSLTSERFLPESFDQLALALEADTAAVVVPDVRMCTPSRLFQVNAQVPVYFKQLPLIRRVKLGERLVRLRKFAVDFLNPLTNHPAGSVSNRKELPFLVLTWLISFHKNKLFVQFRDRSHIHFD